jgi:hypothetical protein
MTCNPCEFHMFVNLNILLWISVLVSVATGPLARTHIRRGPEGRKIRTHHPWPDVSNRLFSALLDRELLIP